MMTILYGLWMSQDISACQCFGCDSSSSSNEEDYENEYITFDAKRININYSLLSEDSYYKKTGMLSSPEHKTYHNPIEDQKSKMIEIPETRNGSELTSPIKQIATSPIKQPSQELTELSSLVSGNTLEKNQS